MAPKVIPVRWWGCVLNAGHDVQLLADRSTLAAAQAQGVSAQALSGDMKAMVGNFLLHNCHFERSEKSYA